MISLQIISQNLNQLKEISRLLIDSNLILKSHIISNVITVDSENTTNQYLCTCNTKALFYKKIEEIIKLKYQNDAPELYSLPIVNMDWNQSRLIEEKVKNALC
jgi:hypothetical protein